MRLQLGLGLPAAVGARRSGAAAASAERAGVLGGETPVAARATMRLSRSVPSISTRTLGDVSRQTAAIVYASAP
jgi:hypothetical protein